MPADICVFHGTEIDDASLLPSMPDDDPRRFWYVGVFHAEYVEPDSIMGPYLSKQEAQKIARQEWL